MKDGGGKGSPETLAAAMRGMAAGQEPGGSVTPWELHAARRLPIAEPWLCSLLSEKRFEIFAMEKLRTGSVTVVEQENT